MKLNTTLFSVLSVLSLLCTPSCATKEQRVLSGSAVGGGIGLAIGHHHGKNSKSRIVGASTGLLVGGVLGYFFDPKNKKPKPTVKADSKLEKATQVSAPFLTRPKVSMYWEPDKIEGNKYIEKHRVWILKSGSTWTR